MWRLCAVIASPVFLLGVSLGSVIDDIELPEPDKPEPELPPPHPRELPNRRLWGPSAPLRLRLQLCDQMYSDSNDDFTITFPSNPEILPVVTKISASPGGHWDYELESMPAPAPTSISIAPMGANGLCIQSAQINGVPMAADKLPTWLDNPCELFHSYHQVPCHTALASDIALPATTTTTVTATTTTLTTTTETTTTTTTTTTSTSTVTSTTITSTTTTSTSITTPGETSTSTTTTTTAGTFEAFSGAVAPEVFGDEFKAKLALNIHEDMLIEPKKSQVEEDACKAIAIFVGLQAPSQVICDLHALVGDRDAQGELTLKFQVRKGSAVSAEQMRQDLRNPLRRGQLNQLLAHGPNDSEDYERTTEAHNNYEDCRFSSTRTLTCCVHSVVYGIIHNASVVKAYKWSFLLSIVLLVTVCVVLLRALREAGLHGEDHKLGETVRGYVVIPLLIIGCVFEASVYGIKSIEKYNMLAKDCANKIALAAVCPPSPGALSFELTVFVGLLLVSGLLLLRPLCRRWKRDIWLEKALPKPPEQPKLVVGCKVEMLWRDQWMTGNITDMRDAERGVKLWAVECDDDASGTVTWSLTERVRPLRRPVSILQQYHTMPLESVLRRCYLVAFLEPRPTDIATPMHRILIVVMNMLISFAVVNVSFFALQRYEFPGRLAAWLPYKLVMELVVAALIKLIFGMIFTTDIGKRARQFGVAAMAMVTLLNIFMWVQVASAVDAFADWEDISARMHVLDITLGAGLVNFLLSPLIFSLPLLVFSVYIYEPILRQKVYRVVHLTKPEQVQELLDALDQEHHGDGDVGTWQMKGSHSVRGKPVLVKGLDADDSFSNSVSVMKSLKSLRHSRSASPSKSEDESEEEEPEIPKVSPSVENPVIIQLRNVEASHRKKLFIRGLDLLMSVESALPVVRHPHMIHKEAETELDSDGISSSESDGKESRVSSTPSTLAFLRR